MFYRTILILFVFSSISLFGQSYYSVHGWDVEARVDTLHGYFGIGQYSTGRCLTYDYTNPSIYKSSNFVLRIDSVDYAWDTLVCWPVNSINSLFNSDSSGLITSTNTIRNRWDIIIDSINTIRLEQFFTPVENKSSGMIEVRYVITNDSPEPHFAGLEHKWDVCVGSHDGPPLFHPESDVNIVWADSSSVPEWIGINGIPGSLSTGFYAEIGLKILDATTPDFVAYGDESPLIYSCFTITPSFAGGYYSYSAALIRWNDRVILPGESIVFITYYGLGGDFLVRDLDIGWNLFSLSCSTSMTAGSVSTLGEYGYDNPTGDYYVAGSLDPGKGYWGLISEPSDVLMFADLEFYSDTVHTGWNLIGAVDHPISRSEIATVPSGLMLDLFGWSPSTASYYPADSLYPGFGYWLLSSGDGNITVGP